MKIDIYIYFKTCDFFQNFLSFIIALCAYRLSPFRDAATDVVRCPPRPRLWTMW